MVNVMIVIVCRDLEDLCINVRVVKVLYIHVEPGPCRDACGDCWKSAVLTPDLVQFGAKGERLHE